MTTKEIWLLPVEKRFAAFLNRWMELDQQTGNRTLQEKDEMAEIADAILPSIIRFIGEVCLLCEKWRPQARSLPEDMKAFIQHQPNTVPMAATYGVCLAQLETLVERLEGKQ